MQTSTAYGLMWVAKRHTTDKYSSFGVSVGSKTDTLLPKEIIGASVD